MTATTVALLGAGGALGSLVRAQLEARGSRVRAIPRASARDAAAIAAALDGVPAASAAIVDCAGASTALAFGRGWRGFGAVDTPIGLAAAAAARRTGARIIYVATHFAAAQRATPYVAAHERVVDAIRDLPGCAIRATGFFSAFGGLVDLARRGVRVDVGRGAARTNPIDDRDLAELVADRALAAHAPGAPLVELAAGGPDVLTRREIFERIIAAAGAVAGAAAGRRVRLVRMPVWLALAGAALLSPLHPRIAQFGRFACGLGRHDVVAPVAGARHLADYLAGRAMLAA